MLKNLPARQKRARAADEREVNPFQRQEIPQTYEEIFRRALSKNPARKRLPKKRQDGINDFYA